MVESDLASLKSSPQAEAKKQHTLTDEYAIDATGVTELTLKKFMEYLDLPDDKPEAEEKFRELLERTGSKPVNRALK